MKYRTCCKLDNIMADPFVTAAMLNSSFLIYGIAITP